MLPVVIPLVRRIFLAAAGGFCSDMRRVSTLDSCVLAVGLCFNMLGQSHKLWAAACCIAQRLR
jgi:hypothetical protein